MTPKKDDTFNPFNTMDEDSTGSSANSQPDYHSAKPKEQYNSGDDSQGPNKVGWGSSQEGDESIVAEWENQTSESEKFKPDWGKDYEPKNSSSQAQEDDETPPIGPLERKLEDRRIENPHNDFNDDLNMKSWREDHSDAAEASNPFQEGYDPDFDQPAWEPEYKEDKEEKKGLFGRVKEWYGRYFGGQEKESYFNEKISPSVDPDSIPQNILSRDDASFWQAGVGVLREERLYDEKVIGPSLDDVTADDSFLTKDELKDDDATPNKAQETFGEIEDFGATYQDKSRPKKDIPPRSPDMLDDGEDTQDSIDLDDIRGPKSRPSPDESSKKPKSQSELFREAVEQETQGTMPGMTGQVIDPRRWSAADVEGFLRDEAGLDYNVIKLVGRGGFGHVWLLENEQGKRAIKLLPYKVDESEWRVISEALREGAVTTGLNHPNIVKAYQRGRFIGGGREVHYILMEYLEGLDMKKVYINRPSIDELQAQNPSLIRIIEDNGPVNRSVPEELRTGRMINLAKNFQSAGSGVYQLHRINLGWFDGKPLNIMICNDGNVKIMDFGLTRGGTTTGSSGGGTPKYAHADQVSKKFVDPKTGKVNTQLDIYSLSLSLLDCALGRDTDVGDYIQINPTWRIRDPESCIETARAEIPDPLLVKVIEKGLSSQYPSARAMCTDLQSVVNANTQSYDLVLNRAISTENKGDIRRAIALYEQAAGLAENDHQKGKAFFYLGNAQLNAGMEEEAAEAHKVAAEKDTSYRGLVDKIWKGLRKII